ncbi:MAG: hypothetical protein KDC87_06175 [Planctomycetes bacterium]|nr:hypothetical protein [Planctomycetota bacterium]
MPPSGEHSALAEWREIAPLVAQLAHGRSDAALDRRRSARHMTIRETIHHIAEANVVAGAIVTAALGSPGCVFDWSWMLPFGPWMERMHHGSRPVQASVRMVQAMGDYVAALVEPLEDGLSRVVKLRDEPEGDVREVTVADVLAQEAKHAREHVAEVAAE